MEASKKDEDQKNVIDLLETALEQAKNGVFDKVILICRFTDTQDVSAGWANVNTYDLGGMVMQGSVFIASKNSENKDEKVA